MMPTTIPFLAEISKLQEQVLLPLVLRLSRLPEQPWIKAGAEPGGDVAPGFFPVYEKCRDYTLTPVEAMYTMYDAAAHVAKANIPGDVAECGVWKGGSSMIVALALLEHGAGDRRIFLYDTFEGTPQMETRDTNVGNGPFQLMMQITSLMRGGSSGIFYAPLEEVRANMQLTGYPADRVVLVKGMVENTLPAQAPQHISLLHLDSDLYRSTYHELTHLFPRLSVGGVLIIDDYGTWKGSREATDQYFKENGVSMYLKRVGDSGARIGIKTAPTQDKSRT
jgi:O-methyltransferase